MAKKILICLIVVIIFFLTYLYSKAVARNCKEEVLSAKLKLIVTPGKTLIKQFVISADNKEIICLLTIWDKSLIEYENFYCLTALFPKESRNVSKEQGENIIAEWKKMKGEEGVTIENPGSVTYMRKEEFGIYNINDSRWRKISWVEGSSLFKKFKGKIIDTVMGEPKEVSSPDGGKIVYIKVLKEKDVSFLTLKGYAYAFEIGVRCIDGTDKRIYKTHYDEFCQWNVQWSCDGSFVLIVDSTRCMNKNDKFYFLTVNKG